MSKIILICFLALFASHSFSSDETKVCDVNKLFADTTKLLDEKSLQKLISESGEARLAIEDSDIISSTPLPPKKISSPPPLPKALKAKPSEAIVITENDFIEVLPASAKKPPPLPQSAQKTKVINLTEVSSPYLNDHEVLRFVDGPLEETRKGPPPLPKKGPPPLPKSVGISPIEIGEADFVEVAELPKKTPPPLPAHRKSTPSAPLKFSVSPSAQKLIDQLPEVETFDFVDSEGKTVKISISKSLNTQLILKTGRPMTPAEFKTYAASKGYDIDLEPLMGVDAKGNPVALKGGFREVYEDKKMSGQLFKVEKSGSASKTTLENKTFMAKRQFIITEYANSSFETLGDDIGMLFEVERENHLFSEVGYTGSKKVPGVSLYNYRKNLSPSELKEFNKKMVEFKKRLDEKQKIAGRMVNRKFRGQHVVKGHFNDAEIAKIWQECADDSDMFVDRMVEKGYLANIDTGLIRFENEGLGTVNDLNNCHIYDVFYKGKKIPKIHCYDI